ncbi:MAG: HAMP domain-containing protein [Deltaproteobacteria bacterium]|nr:HAMP domain-containing protein [Deltaproteobacteria bacterium]
MSRLVPRSIRARLIMLVVVTAALVALPSVVVGYRLNQELPDEVRSLLALEGYATLGMALLAIALAAWLGIRTTRPMTAIREAAQDLASGQLERRVVVEGTVEHRALAGAFNEMAARLEQMVKARYRSEAELRRARNEAVEAAQMKSRFLATMSHEIRTPMNGVIGMVALMRESKLTEEQREFTETIHSSAQQLLAVIDDILDFSKAEAGKLRLVSEPFDLWTTLETVVDLVAPGAEKRGLEVVCSVAPDLPRVVTGDMARLRQILANLVGNAVKFTEHGEIVVRAEPEHRTEHMVAVRVSVHDSGIGIALAAQKNLFQPFVQADDSTSRRFGGTGLGIAIAKQLVEAMHGRIRVDSTPGVGTVFTFTAELGCEEPRAPHRPRWQSKPRAVVIETNDAARTAVTEQLEALGFQVRGARAPFEVDTAPEVTLVDPRVLSEPTAAGLEELRTRMGLADDAPMVLMAPLRQRVGLEVLLTERVRFARKPIRHDTLGAVGGPRDGRAHQRRDDPGPDAAHRPAAAPGAHDQAPGGRHAVSAAGAGGRGQPGEPAGGEAHAREARGGADGGEQRQGGGGRGDPPDLRRRAHGRADAGDGRVSGHGGDPEARAQDRAHQHLRDDRERDAG